MLRQNLRSARLAAELQMQMLCKVCNDLDERASLSVSHWTALFACDATMPKNDFSEFIRAASVSKLEPSELFSERSSR